MANHPTPLEEEDIIEQTIHRELARVQGILEQELRARSMAELLGV